jgi:hypothetical protein
MHITGATTLLLITILLAVNTLATEPRQDLRLWYTSPAAKWVEALPIGNGRLGGMIHGGVKQDVINLNDDTLYSGEPGQRDLPLNVDQGLDKGSGQGRADAARGQIQGGG